MARRTSARAREARRRFLARSAAAKKGWITRRRRERARVRATARRVKAARHGERARRATERKLSAAQIAKRKRDARRVTQKVRRSKKAERNDQRPATSFRSRSSRSSPAKSIPENRSTSKPQPSTKSITIGRGDKFAAQLAVRFDMPAGFTPTPALVREAIQYRIDHGHDAPHVTTKILRWRNPGRRRGEDRAWRQGNQPDAWNTLGAVLKAAVQ